MPKPRKKKLGRLERNELTAWDHYPTTPSSERVLEKRSGRFRRHLSTLRAHLFRFSPSFVKKVRLREPDNYEDQWNFHSLQRAFDPVDKKIEKRFEKTPLLVRHSRKREAALAREYFREASLLKKSIRSTRKQREIARRKMQELHGERKLFCGQTILPVQ